VDPGLQLACLARACRTADDSRGSAGVGWSLDEKELGSFGLVDEGSGADDVLDRVVEVLVRWFMSADMRHAQRCLPEATICSRNSGTSGTPMSAIDFFSFAVAIDVIQGRPPRPWGRWVAGLPSRVQFRLLLS
jgi:hypothetical protein